MNKNIVSLFVALLIALVLTACGNSSESSTNKGGTDNSSDGESSEINERTFRFGNTFMEDNHKNKFGEKLSEILEEKTDGKMKVEIFPSSQLGDDSDMLNDAQSGNLELVMGPFPLLTNFMPEAGIFDLPYIFDDQEQAEKILESEVGTYFLKKLEDHDLVGLGYIYPMERNIFSKKRVTNADEYKGFKIREQEAPGYIKAHEALGAQPSAMGYSEVFTAIQQGVVDAATGAPDQVIQDGFDELVDYFIRAGIHIPVEAFMMSKAVWDDLNEAEQKIFQEAFDEAIKYQKEVYLEITEESLDQMRDEGIEIIEMEDIDVDSLKEKSMKIYDELIADIPDGEELYQMIEDNK